MTSSAAEQPIVFFDSGIGGLPYLQMFRERSPKTSIVFFADSKNFPYGTKSKDEINSIIIETMGRIIETFNPQLIVIACNTASVTSLSLLRQTFNIPFVGVVPAVKPAAERTKTGKIGVLATTKTINTIYLDQLISDFAADCVVEKYGDPDIVRIVEYKDSISRQEKLSVLDRIKIFFSEHPIDYLILACTHFIYLAEDLKRFLGSNVQIIDSREGVVNQVIRLSNGNIQNEGYQFFYTSANEDQFPRLIKNAEEFQLNFKGNLNGRK